MLFFATVSFYIFTSFNIDNPKSEYNIGDKNVKTLSDRIKGKHGRVRSNLMGKRVEFSARTVITPDPYVNIDQLGVPLKIAMELTIPEEVIIKNINTLNKLITNGKTYILVQILFLRHNINGILDHDKIDL